MKLNAGRISARNVERGGKSSSVWKTDCDPAEPFCRRAGAPELQSDLQTSSPAAVLGKDARPDKTRL